MLEPEGGDDVPAARQAEDVLGEERAVPGVARLIEPRDAVVRARGAVMSVLVNCWNGASS